MRGSRPLAGSEVARLPLADDAARRARRLLGVVGRVVAAHDGLAVVERCRARADARQLPDGIDQDAHKVRTDTNV